MSVQGFPNMLMLLGPHTALGNIPRSIEYNVEWVTDLLRFMRDRGLTRLDARPRRGRGVDEDGARGVGGPAVQRGEFMVHRREHQRRGQADPRIARYSGSAPAYRARCDEVAAHQYREMDLR